MCGGGEEGVEVGLLLCLVGWFWLGFFCLFVVGCLFPSPHLLLFELIDKKGKKLHISWEKL